MNGLSCEKGLETSTFVGVAVEPLSVIWDRPIWKAQALDRSLPMAGDIADPQRAEGRWSRLHRGLATSRPWLLQEAGGILGQDIAIPPESRELCRSVNPRTVGCAWRCASRLLGSKRAWFPVVPICAWSLWRSLVSPPFLCPRLEPCWSAPTLPLTAPIASKPSTLAVPLSG